MLLNQNLVLFKIAMRFTAFIHMQVNLLPLSMMLSHNKLKITTIKCGSPTNKLLKTTQTTSSDSSTDEEVNYCLTETYINLTTNIIGNNFCKTLQ